MNRDVTEIVLIHLIGMRQKERVDADDFGSENFQYERGILRVQIPLFDSFPQVLFDGIFPFSDKGCIGLLY